jgi:hypothetical protein
LQPVASARAEFERLIDAIVVRVKNSDHRIEQCRDRQ